MARRVRSPTVATLTICRGCGETHPVGEVRCPHTKRRVSEGAFGTMLGPYRVGKLLGAGSFGVVHVAVDTRTGVNVALKVLHPELVAHAEMVDRFMREADVTIRAGNPHIVRVFDASFSHGVAYVALELLQGETLGTVMRAGAIDAGRAVDIAIQLLDGLAVAHAAGIIHRDIKPANVFLADMPGAPCSRAVILDFGIGRMLVADEAKRLTQTGMQLGTPHFMAPEQLIDSKRADARADLYSVAATLFVMLTCERPYGPVSIGEWVVRVTRGDEATRAVSPIERLRTSLVDAIAIGLSVDPAKRFQDAGAFARALLDAMPNSPAATRVLPALVMTPTFARPAPKTLRGAGPVAVLDVPGDALPTRRVDPPVRPAANTVAPKRRHRYVVAAVAAIAALAALAYLVLVAIAHTGDVLANSVDRQGQAVLGRLPTAPNPAGESPAPTANTPESVPQPVEPAAPSLDDVDVPRGDAQTVGFRCSEPMGELRGGLYVAMRSDRGFPRHAIEVAAGCVLTLRSATLRGVPAAGGQPEVPAIRVIGDGRLRLVGCEIDGDIMVLGPGRVELVASGLQGHRRVMGGGAIVNLPGTADTP